jgi:hypothetical protein
MKTCPSCCVTMEEVEPAKVPSEPFVLQLQPDEPTIKAVGRTRFECPKCHHLEEGFPLPDV